MSSAPAIAQGTQRIKWTWQDKFDFWWYVVGAFIFGFLIGGKIVHNDQQHQIAQIKADARRDVERWRSLATQEPKR